MKKIADIESWKKIGLSAGWITTAGEEVDEDEVIRQRFIDRMKGYGLTEEEIERALESGHLERLERRRERER